MHHVDFLGENTNSDQIGFFFVVCPTLPVQLLVPDPSTLFCSVTRTSSNLIQQSCDVSVTRSIWFLIGMYERELRGDLGVSCWRDPCCFLLISKHKLFQNNLIFLRLLSETLGFIVLSKTNGRLHCCLFNGPLY